MAALIRAAWSSAEVGDNTGTDELPDWPDALAALPTVVLGKSRVLLL